MKRTFTASIVLMMLFGMLPTGAHAKGEGREKRSEPVRTTFQSAQSYSDAMRVSADSVMVYPFVLNELEPLFASWKDKGYRIDAMISVNHDWFGIYSNGGYDGKKHEDEIQRDAQGNPIGFLSGTYYMVPTMQWVDYLYQYAKRSVEAGARRIVLEEPEPFKHSGYSDAFKREWKAYYGEEWTDPAASVQAAYKSSKLKVILFERAISEVSRRIKAEYPDIEVMVAAHSTMSYHNNNIIASNSSYYGLEGVDGMIAQAWTDTAKKPVPYAGGEVSRPFESAFLEYNSFANLRSGKDDKPLYALADPKADDPNHGWVQYERWYKQTISAQLLQPEFEQFQILPWPDRSFASAPNTYKTVQTNVFQALRDMYGERAEIEAGTEGITFLYADNLTQLPSVGGVSASDAVAAFYGPTIPLVERGLPVDIMPADRLISSDALKDTKVLVVSYDFWKPEKQAYHKTIAEWVRKGGTLVYLGGVNPYNDLNEWWNRTGISSPEQDLWRVLGMELKPEDVQKAELPAGQSSLALVPAASSGGFGGGQPIRVPKRYTVTSSRFPGAKVLYQTEDQPVVSEKSVGRGKMLHVGITPSYFASSRESAELMRGIVRYALESGGAKYRESNTMTAVRGLYRAIETLARPERITGTYIDLYDPNLPIVTDLELLPDSSALLYDIRKINTNKPTLLYVSGEVTAKSEKAAFTSYIVKGTKGSTAAARIGSSKMYPKAVIAKDSRGNSVPVNWAWENASRSLLVKHGHDHDGVTVDIEWSRQQVADSVMQEEKELLITTGNKGGDSSYIVRNTGSANDEFRFVDADGELVYRFDLSAYPEAVVSLDLNNNYVVSASPDGLQWTELFNAQELFGRDVQDGSNRGKQSFESERYRADDGTLYLKLEDGSKDGGWGGILYSIGIQYLTEPEPIAVTVYPDGIEMEKSASFEGFVQFVNRTPVARQVRAEALQVTEETEWIGFVPATDGESAYLAENNDSGINPGAFRFADADSYFVYRLPIPAGTENPVLELTLQNQYEVSFSADGSSWTPVSSESARVTDGSNLATKAFSVASYAGGNLYVKIGDSHKDDGWGGLLTRLSLKGSIPAAIRTELADTEFTLKPHESKVVGMRLETGADISRRELQAGLSVVSGDDSLAVSIPVQILSPKPVYVAAKAQSAPDIDGVVSPGEWEDAPVIRISPESEHVRDFGQVWGEQSEPGDLDTKYRIKWDGDYLYLLEERADNALQFTETGSRMYFSDAVLFFLDTDHGKQGSQYVDGDYSIFLTAGGPDGLPHAFMREGADSGVIERKLELDRMASTLNGNAFTFEVAIPWSELSRMPSQPETGAVMGMTILATDQDNDSGQSNWGQIMWVGNGDDQSGWAELELGE